MVDTFLELVGSIEVYPIATKFLSSSQDFIEVYTYQLTFFTNRNDAVREGREMVLKIKPRDEVCTSIYNTNKLGRKEELTLKEA